MKFNKFFDKTFCGLSLSATACVLLLQSVIVEEVLAKRVKKQNNPPAKASATQPLNRGEVQMPNFVNAVPSGPVLPADLPKSGETVVDEIYAVVNNDAITRSDVAYRIGLIEQKLKQMKQPIPSRQALVALAMERAITDKIMLQRAKDLNIEVNDREVQEYFESLAKVNDLSGEDFVTKLKISGIPISRFLMDLRNEIVFNRLRKKDVDRSSPVTEKEIDSYLRNWATRNPSSDNTVQEYHLMQIVVKPKSSSKADFASAQIKAQSILAKAKANEDIGELVVHDPLVAVEDLGYRQTDRIPTVFANVVTQLNSGSYSDQIVQSPKGFHVLRLMDSRKAPGEPAIQIPQVEARHILLRDTNQVIDQDLHARLDSIRTQVLNSENKGLFDEMARVYSEDPGSAASGGYLGWVTSGTMVGEFEEAMNNTPVGQVSPPFKTRFGWHIVQVTGKREAQASKAEQRSIAKKALEQMKEQEVAQNWLKDLRDTSYVEYRVNLKTLP